jgi:phosphoenolpyruvate carboxykinase (GTP)
MLKKNEGIDIVKEIGGVRNIEQAQALFEKRLDEEHLSRIRTLSHPEILIKIANAIAMCDPARVFINTGSEADCLFIRQLALYKGEEAILPMDRAHDPLRSQGGAGPHHRPHLLHRQSR